MQKIIFYFWKNTESAQLCDCVPQVRGGRQPGRRISGGDAAQEAPARRQVRGGGGAQRNWLR